MAKKNFKTGVDGMIREKDAIQVEIDSKNSVTVEIKQVEKEKENELVFSSIDVDKEIAKAFKIKLLRMGLGVHDFFLNEVDKLIEEKDIVIPVTEDNNLGKYSFRIYNSTKEKLRVFGVQKEVRLKDVYIYLMMMKK